MSGHSAERGAASGETGVALARGPRGWLRGALDPLRGAPASTLYLSLLVLAAALLIAGRGHGIHWLVRGASTNLDNMTSRPVHALVASAFWLEHPWLLGPMALLTLVVMAPVERWLGTARTLLAFGSGHVGATVATVSVVGFGVGGGWLPRSLAYAIDVGPSYGLAALAGVLVTRVRAGWARRTAIAVLLAGLALAALLGATVSDAGHLVAALVGLALSPWLTRRREAVAEQETVQAA